MNILFFVLIIIAVFIALLFIEDLRVKLVFDTEKNYMNMTLSWMYPFIKILVTIENTKPVVMLYIFNNHLFRKVIKNGKGKFSRMDLIKIVKPKDVRINTEYGFRDSFNTGITCGAINTVSQFINIESFKHNPDFTTQNDYIYFDASANVNLGSTFISFLKQKVNRRNFLWIRT